MSDWDKVSRWRLAAEIIGRPIGWAGGAIAASVVGLLNVDILSAFILGLTVGLVHDIALYYLHVIGYGARVRGIRFEDRFAAASRVFSSGDWEGALPLVEELHYVWPSHKGALYLLIRCYEKAERWEKLVEACDRYMRLLPRKDETLEIKRMRETAVTQLGWTS